MENKNLRNVLMAAGLAVFAGVLTLGVNAAFGLDVPSQDPAGAALHSPVFKDVNVENDVNAGNNLYVGKNIQAGENITVGGLVLTTNATGDIINQDQDSPVVIDDNLNVTGVADITKHLVVRQDIDVNGLINNSSNKNEGAVVIDDINGLTVKSGTSTFNNTETNLNGNLTVGFKNPEVLRNVTLNANTTTKGSLSVGTGLTAKSFIDALGGIKNTTVVVEGVSNVPKPVKIDDALEVANNAVIDGDLFATQNLTVTNNANITKDLTVSGNTNISGGASVSGSLTVGAPGVDGNLTLKGGGGKIMTKGTTNAGVNFDNPIVQTGWIGGGLAFGDYTALNSGYAWTGSEPISVVAGQNGVFFSKGNNGTAYQTQLGKIDTSGNLSMTGGITATKIGSYNKVSSAGQFAPYVKLPANGGNMSSNAVLCPAYNIAVNCGFSLYSDNAGTPYNGSGIYLEGMVNGAAGTAGCNYAIVNSTATDKYAKLTIMCFDPTTNN